MDLQIFRESELKQQNGTPIPVGDSIFFCRRYGTEASEKALNEIRKFLYGPFHKVSQEDFNLVLAHWFVEYGITGWENLQDGGVEVPYSEMSCREIFLNPQFYLSLNKTLWIDVNNFENYLHDETLEEIEDIKKL